MDKRRR